MRVPIIALKDCVSCPIFTMRRRFVSTASISGNLSIFDLINQFMFATTTTSLYPTTAAIRLKKIALLSPVTVQGSSVTCLLRPQNTSTDNNLVSVNETLIDTSASIDVPAYLSITPSVQTPIGSWHYSTNTNSPLCAITCPNGSCMDLTMEFIPAWNSTPSSYIRTVVGATVGQSYGATILTNFIPQGVIGI